MRLRRGTSVTNSGDATAGAGGIANTGSIGRLTVLANASVRGQYLEQVRRIAPARLLDRDDELAELAAFCTDPEHAGAYVWWQAPAWAGKSALLSWFVLHPPKDTRIVSFFITGRLAGQNDRRAFLDNVIEQLAELVGEPAPSLLTDATRDAHFLGLLGDAARSGSSFVLLVDGLDEDRGVTTGPDAHSIAGLLPATLPAGMRVVVSGRANPPVPFDVPDDHPLRSASVVRALSPSGTARAVQTDLTREVKRLVQGESLDRELLGFLTAANGGLSAGDLAELTGRQLWEVEEHLASVSGRSFVRRPAWWRPESAPEVFVLAHEELHVAATKYLGPDVLGGHRQRLHEWAARYKEAKWPENTPQYLLRDYQSTLDGDLERMTALAADPARHDRQFLLSGGDVAAGNEIEAVAANRSDLVAVARMAVHRSRLDRRALTVPIELPAVLARLGHVRRAVALAYSTRTLLGFVPALVRVMAAINGTEYAGFIPQLFEDLGAWVDMAIDQAVEPGERGFFVQSLIETTWAVLDGGDLEALARSLTQPERSARSLVELIRGPAARGDAAEVERLAADVETLLCLVAEKNLQISVSVALVAAVGRISPRFDRLVAETAALIPDEDGAAWLDLIRAVTRSRDLAKAETLAAAFVDPPWRIQATVELAKAHAAAGHTDRVRELVAEARSLCESIDHTNRRAAAAKFAAAVCVHGGEFALADEFMRTAQEHGDKAQVEIFVLDAALTAGALGHAHAIVRSMTDPRRRATALTSLARAELAAGDRGQASDLVAEAERLICTAVEPQTLIGDVVSLVDALREAELPERVPELFDRAEALARAIIGDRESAFAVTSLGVALAKSGAADRAEALVADLVEPEARSEALATVVKALSSVGIAAHPIAARARAAVDAIDNPIAKVVHLRMLARAATAVGDHDSAAAHTAERRLVLDGLEAGLRLMLEREPDGPLQVLPPPPGDLSTPQGIAERLASDGWTTALGALGQVCPDALIAVADEVTAILDHLGVG